MVGELLELWLKSNFLPEGPHGTAIGRILSGGTIWLHEKNFISLGNKPRNRRNLVSSIGWRVPPAIITACASSVTCKRKDL